MTTSAYRTVVIVVSPSVRHGAVLQAVPLRWPVAEPDEHLDYSLNVTALLADVEDTISSASWAISPAGELRTSDLTVTGGLITCWQGAAGVPGRDYSAKVDILTTGGRTFSRLVHLLIDPQAGPSPRPPATPGYGAPLEWNIAPGLTDSSGNVLADSSGNILQGSSGAPTNKLTDSAGNVLTDNAGNQLSGAQ